MALGVAKDAASTTIKQQYRKLVLKFHPDKVQDETQKQAAADQFHKIQTAYEIIGDDDRRGRYDAQCKLAELRRDVMERGGGGARGGVEVRTAAYKVSTESARGGEFYARGPERSSRVSPLYEERTPSGYFDSPPRGATRKSDDFERSTKRTQPPKEDRKSVKVTARETKENDRSRKEKNRRSDNDMRKDRDRKTAYVAVEDEEISSDSEDEYERARRRRREEDEIAKAQARYYEAARKQRAEAEMGYFGDERTRKMFSQHSDAADYIRTSQRRQESERRPAPVRAESSKDKVDYLKREGRPPIMIRRGSGRPNPSPRRSSARESKQSPEIVDETQDSARRPPTLIQTKSAPEGIRPPYEKQRSHSLQDPEHEPIPVQVKRSETMPQTPTVEYSNPFAFKEKESRRTKDSSKLRAEVHRADVDVNSYLTPEATPEPRPRRYSYGTEYADDKEYPTPDGYRTEVREPEPAKPSRGQRFTRSPSPMREKDRSERKRSTSSKYAAPQPPPLNRASTTQYVYPRDGGESYVASRPSMSRDSSGRLYGEIPTTRETRSPKPSAQRYSPPPESVQYSRDIRAEDIKVQSGYNTSRRSAHKDKPSYTRSSSSQQPIRVR